jgi:hypothetical protein
VERAKKTSRYVVLLWERRIRATPERLWAVLTDFPRMHEWFLGVRRVRLAAPAPAAGMERTLTLVTGQSHRERIATWDPPRLLEIEVLEPPVLARDWRASIRLEPVGPDVRLAWSLRYAPRFGPVGRVLDRLVLRPLLRTAFDVSLDRLQSRVR